MSMVSLLKGLLLVFVPVGVSYAGGKATSWLSGRPTAAVSRIANNAEIPLNRRIYGYGADDVAAHWAPFSPLRLQQEKRFLELDLVYPFLYGGVFLAALLVARAWLGRPFDAFWTVLPVALTVVADWVENLVQLHQLGRWTAAAEPAVTDLSAGWIRVASVATTAKLWLLAVTFLFLVVLAALVAFRVGSAE